MTKKSVIKDTSLKISDPAEKLDKALTFLIGLKPVNRIYECETENQIEGVLIDILRKKPEGAIRDQSYYDTFTMKCTPKNVKEFVDFFLEQQEDDCGRGMFDRESGLLHACQYTIEQILESRKQERECKRETKNKLNAKQVK